jgi:hypothetical protein
MDTPSMPIPVVGVVKMTTTTPMMMMIKVTNDQTFAQDKNMSSNNYVYYKLHLTKIIYI